MKRSRPAQPADRHGSLRAGAIHAGRLLIALVGRVGFAALLLAMVLASRSTAQDAPPPPAEEPDEEPAPLAPERPKPPPPTDWAQWNDVERFRGYYEYRRVDDAYHGDDVSVETGYSEFVATARFELGMDGLGQNGALVKGETVGSYRTSGAAHRWSYHGRSSSGGAFQGACPDMRFDMDTKRGTWRFSPAGNLDWTYTYTWQLSSRSYEGVIKGWQDTNRSGSEERTHYPSCSFRGALETGRPGPIRGVWTYTHATPDRKGGSREEGRARVFLVPEYKDVELVVEVEGLMPGGQKVPYEKWIPRGTPTVGVAGSHLVVKARLQAADGGAVKARVDRFSFRLEDTSREPGVCMNFPRVRAPTPEKPATFDLKFAPGGTTDAGRQMQDLAPLLDDPDHPRAEAHVDCFDYGAWSSLSVTAALADGRTITGHLKGDPGAIVIPLPKRSGGSLIADAWKEEHEISAGDADDQEKLPSAGKEPGDGFTLYEEYRGFVENGKHLSGDQKKIDFFVRNYIGGDAVPGIELFGEVTGAVVHHRLRDSEFDKDKRVMNRNHHQGAHAVDQHGVYLFTEEGRDGGATVSTPAAGKAGVRLRPGLTAFIAIQPREADTSINTSENVPVHDQVFAYDQAVLHELLHSVGVEHHGKGDRREFFVFVFADAPGNTTGKASWLGYGEPVTILDETTGRDLAVEMEPDMLRMRESNRAWSLQAVAQMAKERGVQLSDEQIAKHMKVDLDVERVWYVGAPGGECSGHEGCAMRYYFARVYEKKDDPHTYYYISKKPSERQGLELCRSLLGTGKPKLRYGDATAGWGPCADWIVFNDAVPPDTVPK